MSRKYPLEGEGKKSTGFQLARRVRILGITLLSLLALSVGQSQSYEVGYHYDYRGSAAFVYVTTDFNVGYVGDWGVWISPSVEVIFSPAYQEGWVQLQGLFDGPWATLSVRGKYEVIDSRSRAEFRVGLLLGN